MYPVTLFDSRGYNSLQSQAKPQRGQRTLQAWRNVGAPQAGQTVESE